VALVVDTSVLLAALDRNDRDHDACARLIGATTGDIVVPALVLAELDYWCHERLTVEVWLSFLEDVIAGAYRVEAPDQAAFARCHELQTTYADLDLCVVDATIVALLEARNDPVVATLDRRHFGVVRPLHVEALTIVP
jgi:uncharacterized protein